MSPLRAVSVRTTPCGRLRPRPSPDRLPAGMPARGSGASTCGDGSRRETSKPGSGRGWTGPGSPRSRLRGAIARRRATRLEREHLILIAVCASAIWRCTRTRRACAGPRGGSPERMPVRSPILGPDRAGRLQPGSGDPHTKLFGSCASRLNQERNPLQLPVDQSRFPGHPRSHLRCAPPRARTCDGQPPGRSTDWNSGPETLVYSWLHTDKRSRSSRATRLDLLILLPHLDSNQKPAD